MPKKIIKKCSYCLMRRKVSEVLLRNKLNYSTLIKTVYLCKSCLHEHNLMLGVR